MDNLLFREDGCYWRGQIPVLINNKKVLIDREISKYVLELNKRGYKTIGSCAGHVCKEYVLDPYIAFDIDQIMIKLLEGRLKNDGFTIQYFSKIYECRYECNEVLGLFEYGGRVAKKEDKDYTILIDLMYYPLRISPTARLEISIKKLNLTVKELDRIRNNVMNYLLSKIFI